jgi:GNAT superfamily N-acetyltransferase
MIPPLVRMAKPEDYQAYARLVPELGIDDPIPDSERFGREIMQTMLMVEEQSRITAFGWYKTYESMGYVVQLVVEPAARRRGIGRQLMLEMAAEFRRSGCTHWCLNARPENHRALSLYRSLGMREVYRSMVLRVALTIVGALPDAGEQSVAVRLTPERTPLVEQSLGLPAGRLSEAMHIGERITMELRSSSGSCLGIAVFDPSFLGVYPFRVREARWAKPLFLALLPHAPPEASYLQIVAEGDPELTRCLLSRGALSQLEVAHLEGVLETCNDFHRSETRAG